MGMGEPLDNIDNVINAIKLLNMRQSFGIGEKCITVSTVGLVDQMKMLIDQVPKINIAISLHAPNAILRGEIVPVSKK